MAHSSPPVKSTQSTFDFNNQSIILEGPEGIRTSTQNDVENGEFFKVYDKYENLYESFLDGVKISENEPCLGTRPTGSNEYVWKTYTEVKEWALEFGSGLIEKKGWTTGKEEAFVGIYSANRVEWVIADIACAAYNITPVPLYDTLGASAVTYILNLVEISVVICDNYKKVNRLLDQKSEIESLKLVIVAEKEIPDDVATKAKNAGVEVVTFTEITKLGKNHRRGAMPGKSTDLFTLAFTSGTTGDPKGVMLINANQLCMPMLLDQVGMHLDKNDTHLSYLPLAHALERTVLWVILNYGAQFGFFGGDPKKLMEDAVILKPTIFVAVPRILNKLYDKLTAGVNSFNIVKRSLFNFAYKKKESMLLNQGVLTKDSIWDKLMFQKIQAILGGRVRYMVTGAAPIRGDVLRFTRIVFGAHIFEGYGQTESTATATMTLAGDFTPGHVGPPVTFNMIKLVDVPENDYYAKDGKGEICFKGSNVFKGYYKKPDLTAKALDKDGWLHSGDIGQWLENGTLKIIDRKKNIFKLSQGEYVAPEKLENIYVLCPLIAQIFVYGNSHENYTVAIVVPDEEELMKRASHNKWKGTFEELCNNGEVKSEILREMATAGINAKLVGFEKVKYIYVLSEPFSVENGALTPTLKSKRAFIQKTHKEHLDSMYNNN